MKKRVLFSFLFIIINFLSYGQSLGILLKIKERPEDYPIVIKAHPLFFEPYVKRNDKIKIGSRLDSIFTVYTNLKHIQFLAQQPWVYRLEDAFYEVKPLMDSMRILNNIDTVHKGLGNLSKSYQGDSVVIGIIDFGLDYRNQDFKEPNGSSRIEYLWDHNGNSNAPNGFNYGKEYSNQDLNSNIGPLKDATGHGTNVTGISCGNGNLDSNYKGVAPKSKIIGVVLKSNTTLNQVVDGIRYIFNKADSLLNLPCVINTSVGTYDGSHDGIDLISELIDSMILSKKGRIVVAANGNAGNLNQHIQMQPNQDTLFTNFTRLAKFNGVYYNFYANLEDIDSISIGVRADSISNFKARSLPYFYSFKNYKDSVITNKSILISNKATGLNGDTLGTINHYISIYKNVVKWEVFIETTLNTWAWRMMATGHGKLDMWVNASLQTTSPTITTGLPSVSTNPSMAYYKLPDSDMSLCSGFQCSPNVISVGNYTNKVGHLDPDSVYRFIGGVQNEIAAPSSKGPTRIGLIKPDISATGSVTMTTIDSTLRTQYLVNSNRTRLSKNTFYTRAGGTSMASPVVAGVCALMLQKNKNVGATEMIQTIHQKAKKDNFTGLAENNTYGYGKLDAYPLLLHNFIYGCTDSNAFNFNPNANVDNGSCIPKVFGCLDTASINYNANANTSDSSCIPKVYGCTDSNAFNFNPNANVDNGSCIPKIYGCMDSVALNYNPKANIDNDSCLYASNIDKYDKPFRIYPNPFESYLYIEMNDSKTTQLEIYNVNNQRLIQRTFNQKLIIDLRNFQSGVYILILSNKKHYYIEKIRKL